MAYQIHPSFPRLPSYPPSLWLSYPPLPAPRKTSTLHHRSLFKINPLLEDTCFCDHELLRSSQACLLREQEITQKSRAGATSRQVTRLSSRVSENPLLSSYLHLALTSLSNFPCPLSLPVSPSPQSLHCRNPKPAPAYQTPGRLSPSNAATSLPNPPKQTLEMHIQHLVWYVTGGASGLGLATGQFAPTFWQPAHPVMLTPGLLPLHPQCTSS